MVRVATPYPSVKSTSTQACTVKLSSGSGKLQIQNVSINIHLRSSTPHLHFYLGEFDPYYGAFLIVQLANIDCLDVYKQQQVCLEEELSLSEVADEPQACTTCSPPKVSFEEIHCKYFDSLCFLTLTIHFCLVLRSNNNTRIKDSLIADIVYANNLRVFFC